MRYISTINFWQAEILAHVCLQRKTSLELIQVDYFTSLIVNI